MSSEEIKQLTNEIIKEQKLLASSKEAATKYLIELGILTPKGNLKKAFRALKK